MSTLKRRLNQAIGECRSQASVTARRLVKSNGGRGSTTAAPTTGVVGLARATVAPFGARNRPTFSYSFEGQPDFKTAVMEQEVKQQQRRVHVQEFGAGAGTIMVDAAADGANYIWSNRLAERQAGELQVCQSQLFNGNEFKPNECHFSQQNQANQRKSLTSIMDNQPVAPHNLDRDHYAALTSQLVIEHHQLISSEHHNQTQFSSHDMSSIMITSGEPHDLSVLDQTRDESARFVAGRGVHYNDENDENQLDDSTASGTRQYFIRSSFNASIRTRRSRRSSRRNLRQSGRRQHSTPWRQLRHVRFQPVPQAIDISITSSNGFEREDESPTTTSSGDMPPDSHHLTMGSSSQIRLKNVQQQLTRFCRKSRIQFTGVKPKFSAKPLQHLPGHIKSSFGKIKLKTLNNLASQLQQTLTSTHNHNNHNNERQTGQPAATKSAAASGAKTKLTLPIQRTFHLRNSAASAKHQITLSINNQKVISPADLEALHAGVALGSCYKTTGEQQQQHVQHDDDGWGSDFDESQSTTGAEDASLNSTGGAAGSYLLEIGKSSCDTRAICDVIQDQGISGQFKRLQDVSCIEQVAEGSSPVRRTVNRNQVEACQDTKLGLIRASLADETDGVKQADDSLEQTTTEKQQDVIEQPAETKVGPSDSEEPQMRETTVERRLDYDEINNTDEAENDHDDDAAEEEAELRSLEARQNFKQVRDKLKLILEQRLASYERDLKPKQSTAMDKAPQAGCSAKAVGSSCGPKAAIPIPPPLPRKPSEPIVVASGATAAPFDGKQAAERQAVHVNHDHFDCQSNCSEASSLSSGGLDSNHSGSQDSGHSTQHSADDGRSSTARRAAKLHSKSTGPTCSSLSPGSACSVVVVGNCVGSRAANQPLPSTAATTRYPLDAATRMRLLEQQRQMSLKLKQKPRRRTAKRALNLECSASLGSASSSSASPPSSDSSSACCNRSLDNQSISTTSGEVAAGDICSYQRHFGDGAAASERDQTAYNQRLNLNEEIRKFHFNRNSKNQSSFTRQLSMVCLRQLEHREVQEAPALVETVANVSTTNEGVFEASWHKRAADNRKPFANSAQKQQLELTQGNLASSSAKSALSLRELIKEVIDNCEKPGKLSKLTRSILTRSDSLSSQDESAGRDCGESSSASDQDKP